MGITGTVIEGLFPHASSVVVSILIMMVIGARWAGIKFAQMQERLVAQDKEIALLKATKDKVDEKVNAGFTELKVMVRTLDEESRDNFKQVFSQIADLRKDVSYHSGRLNGD